MIPVIHSIGPEIPISLEEAKAKVEKATQTFADQIARLEFGECENNVKDRIAGTTAAAQTIKNQYYLGSRFPVGSQVLCDDGWTGNVIEVLNHSIVSVRWTHHSNGKPLEDRRLFVTTVSVDRLTLVMK
jgi:hypothetical protein